MTKIKIVTDSAALIQPEEAAKYDITVVPLTVMIDGTMYQDGVTISREEFALRAQEAKGLPTTSQPPLGAFTEVYERLAQDGEDVAIISIHLTKGLSGTFDAAQQAARMVNADVTVVDSDFIDRSEAFQVLTAAELAQTGASKEAILAAIDDVRKRTDLYLTVSELDNLVAGGRLSKTAGFVAGLMNIHVGAHVQSGNINVEAKGRGPKATKKYLAQAIDKVAQNPAGVKRVDIAHTSIPRKAHQLAAVLKQRFPGVTVRVLQTSPTVTTHTGPGAFGVSFEFNA